MIYHALPTLPIDQDCDYIHSGALPEIVHLNDPATDVMLDFKHTKALTIGPDSPIFDARQEMTLCGVHVLLATDAMDQVVGIISLEDILGAKPVKIIQERHIKRSEVQVKMVMTPRQQLKAIPMTELRGMQVGHVIQTLQDTSERNLLVVETSDTNTQAIRGIFSLSQISKQLAIRITADDLHARSLADLQKEFS